MNFAPKPRTTEALGRTGADAAEKRLYRILVRDLLVPWHIGIHRHEHGQDQRVRLNIELAVAEPPQPDADDYAAVVCYERVVDGVRKLAAHGHVKLVETLAHQIAALCLTDPRVETATVRVEKLDVFADAASVGIEITRTRADISPAAAAAALHLVSGD